MSDPYSGFVWDPLVLEASRELQPLRPPPAPALVRGSLGVFTVPVSELTDQCWLIVAGQPDVLLHASTTGLRVQLNVRLIDVGPKEGTQELITRGTFMLQGAPGTSNVIIPTYGNLWKVPREHVLRLEITTLDSPYLAPSRIPSATTISDVQLKLPTRSAQGMTCPPVEP